MNEAFWMIDQLVQQGVELFCIAPGSRSTPLVLAAAEHPKARTMVHFDERGLGFYAMGYSQGSRKPAAVISTSGTAVGNLLPCVMEAHQSCIPLLLLTADRPSELRHCGANQATDQVKIFSPFVRWQIDLPPVSNQQFCRTSMAQAVFYACQNPPGPVQINCPFREPFSLPQMEIGSPIGMQLPRLISEPKKVSCSKGVILMGRMTDPKPVLELARRLQWPIFADILSQARIFPSSEQIRHFDWILKRGSTPKPDFILHFGERLTSKKLLEWLKEMQPCPYFHVGPWPSLLDPARLLTGRIQSDEAPFCSTFQAETDPCWLATWKEIDREIEALLEAHFDRDFPFTEAHAMRAIGEMLPPHFATFFGNGMPIRDSDHFFFPRSCRGFYCNRGLSGIDGNIAAAAGLADSLKTALLAFIGDQACLHDLNSLPLLKKTQNPVLLIASNNFGSGMFSYLPVSKFPHYETYWAVPHSLRFEQAAKMFDLPYFSTDSDPTEILESLFSSNRSAVLEIFTNREENYRFQKILADSCLLEVV